METSRQIQYQKETFKSPEERSTAAFHSFLKSIMEKKEQDIQAGLREDDSVYLTKNFQEAVDKYNIE
jgi:hypothetical protein